MQSKKGHRELDLLAVRRKPTVYWISSSWYISGIMGTRTKTQSRHPYGEDAGRSDHGGRSVGSRKKVDASKVAEPDEIHPAIVKPLVEVLVEASRQLVSASLDKGRLPLTGRRRRSYQCIKAGAEKTVAITERWV